MHLSSKRVDIFEGPNSDLERIKPLNAKGKGRSTRGKQTTLLKRTKTKRHYNTRSWDISKQTKLGQKVLSSKEQKQFALKNSKSKGRKLNAPRRSAKLKAQGSKDVIST
jgi:hypothetical protein